MPAPTNDPERGLEPQQKAEKPRPNSAVELNVDLRAIVVTDVESRVTPVFTEKDRNSVERYVERVIMDRDVRRKHVLDLQTAYGINDIKRFPHSQILSDEFVRGVLDNKLTALSDEQLISLLLNPFGLAELSDVVGDEFPDSWAELFVADLKEELAREGRTLPTLQEMLDKQNSDDPPLKMCWEPGFIAEYVRGELKEDIGEIMVENHLNTCNDCCRVAQAEVDNAKLNDALSLSNDQLAVIYRGLDFPSE